MSRNRSILSMRQRSEMLRNGNKLVHAMRYLPQAVKDYFTEKYAPDAETAFASLLRGSTHICPACGYDASPIDSRTGQVFACGCDRPHMGAVDTWLKMAGAIGPEQQVIVNLLHTVGARDEAEMERWVMLGRQMEVDRASGKAKTPEEYMRSAMAMAKMCCHRDGALVGLLRETLAEFEGAGSNAVLVEGPQANGDAHGG